MHRRCYLVSCVGSKLADRAAAKDLYISDWFKKARRYVERSASPWFILSAEHGLVSPESVIAPYEKTLNTMGVAERRTWAVDVSRQMETEMPQSDTIVVFAGARYREFLMCYLGSLARRVSVPMEGLAIGKQLSWLGSHTPDDEEEA
jgi:hypothetical protein